MRRVADEIGVPTVNMCLDDKQSWAGRLIGEERAGQIDLASAFDLSWTSARIACDWYIAEGGRPIYMPEGCDISTFRPIKCHRDLAVSFIGAAYGFRKQTIRYLRKYGIPVAVFGPGWGTASVWGEDAAGVMNRSLMNLGMGGIGYSETLTNVKTRDFEVPAAGGGVYLTSFNSDLAQHFVIGEEILCYRDRIEMLELIRYYLSHPHEARAIAARARQRCVREHRWLHRYQRICEILGILDDSLLERRLEHNLVSAGRL
ncbi:MAG: glycosyltransferase [Acidobacteriaceae bacterium]|nr:glycosyltransferase [Acidobacteriaceae bacterium]MBV9779051.1 glycosyltransferase [Acidobacteriaceae bacterium]